MEVLHAGPQLSILPFFSVLNVPYPPDVRTAGQHAYHRWASDLMDEGHGRFGQPCPRCGEKVQRIRYADNETDYCVRCQTGGKVLADRSLSRLMKSDWPRTLDELEALKRR